VHRKRTDATTSSSASASSSSPSIRAPHQPLSRVAPPMSRTHPAPTEVLPAAPRFRLEQNWHVHSPCTIVAMRWAARPVVTSLRPRSKQRKKCNSAQCHSRRKRWALMSSWGTAASAMSKFRNVVGRVHAIAVRLGPLWSRFAAADLARMATTSGAETSDPWPAKCAASTRS